MIILFLFVLFCLFFNNFLSFLTENHNRKITVKLVYLFIYFRHILHRETIKNIE